MTGGRAILGTGPGALPSDAHTLGIDPMTQRDRQDEAIGVIKRLLAGERVTHESEWFTLRDARLQLLPLQEEMEMVAASSISPSGMTLAGKYGMGVLSIGSNSDAGLAALPTQWGFAEQAAAKSGKAIDRKNWRVLMSWHIAETREEAIRNTAAESAAATNEAIRMPTLACSAYAGSSNASPVTKRATVKPIPAAKAIPIMCRFVAPRGRTAIPSLMASIAAPKTPIVLPTNSPSPTPQVTEEPTA
jgi:alkanesulfonate monooxygenase SsuD/methylene tetrahydromethanopterin reductase-like flavin-dependent oxidoreductase (luciferase family)